MAQSATPATSTAAAYAVGISVTAISVKKPPLPALQGLFGKPTVINNVLSFASTPWILAEGAAAYTAYGVGRSRGSQPFQLAGNIKRGGLVEQLGLVLDARGNVRTDASGATNIPGVFAGGDAARGQSLVVWAIADGRRLATGVEGWLRRSTMARAANG